jgi:enoyl-CoA hydratase/carnithine racemase
MTIPTTVDCELQFENRVATLAFNRHDVRNALTGTHIIADVLAVLEWARDDMSVGALIVTGNGSAFSAGGNLNVMRERAAESVADIHKNYARGIQRLTRAMRDTDVPIIAAVNGPAIGAGFDFACMCDLRIGSAAAKFGETFVNLGIVPGDGGAWFLERLVGYQRAAELSFTARLVEAAEARDLGILLEVTAADDLLPRARQIARVIADKPGIAVRYNKRLLKLAQTQSLDEHLDACAAFQAICHKTEDHQEALRAVFEKRSAEFKGR